MKRAVRWFLWVLLGSIMEGDSLRERKDGSCPPPTLSAFTRWVFQTDTRAGKVAFLVVLLGWVAWFAPHIVNGKETL